VTGKKLKVVSKFKYLGIVIDSKLTFKLHIKRSAIKSNLILKISGS